VEPQQSLANLEHSFLAGTLLCNGSRLWPESVTGLPYLQLRRVASIRAGEGR